METNVAFSETIVFDTAKIDPEFFSSESSPTMLFIASTGSVSIGRGLLVYLKEHRRDDSP